MGEGTPVPLEEDLPPEITDPTASLFCTIQVWKANWRPVTENTDGYHAPLLHYRSLPRILFMNWVAWRKTTHVETGRPTLVSATGLPIRAGYNSRRSCFGQRRRVVGP